MAANTNNSKGVASVKEVAPANLWPEVVRAKGDSVNSCLCITRRPDLDEGQIWAFQIGCSDGRTTKMTFSQGHDARLKGIFQEMFWTNRDMVVYNADGSTKAYGSGMDFAATRQWEHFLTDSATAKKRLAKLNGTKS